MLIGVRDIFDTELGDKFCSQLQGVYDYENSSSHNSECFQHIKTKLTMILICCEIQESHLIYDVREGKGKREKEGQEKEK